MIISINWQMNSVWIILKIDLNAQIAKLNNANHVKKFLIIKDSLVNNLNYFKNKKNVDIVNYLFVKEMNAN
jgi:hypothetical protein